MKLLLLSLCLYSTVSLTAQRQTSLGLNFTAEITSEDKGAAGLGAIADLRITKHSGLETGIYFRTYKADFYIRTSPAPNDIHLVTVAEKHLSVPLLYKFHTRIVNLSAGPTFDFFIGWEQKGKKDVTVSSYTLDPEFNVGIMGKISKAIRLSDHFILEPELRLNLIPTNERSYCGLGIAGKYVLRNKKTR